GGIGNDSLIGGIGNDYLDGYFGRDTLVGGAGNDLYIVDDDSVVITELSGQGTDTVEASVTYSLVSNYVDHLTLTGFTGFEDINGTGNTLNNTITGNNGYNVIDGQNGNDLLVGNGGNDTLLGGAGSDTLIGGDGDDILDGGPGGDIFQGGDGNDIFRIDNLLDVINDVYETNYINTVEASISYTLPNSINYLVITGTGNLSGTGNDYDNTISGNSGSNTLTGKAGDDTLYGNEGNDVLVGGSGNDILTGNSGLDTFKFNFLDEGVDTITDFVVVDDRILVDASNFQGGLTANAYLSASRFVIGEQATTAAHRFIYDNSLGELYFDRDGTGAVSQVLIATFDGLPSLTSADIYVIP
ncbi:MAG: furin, partial [Gloeotrichia echinulata HAB0833]